MKKCAWLALAVMLLLSLSAGAEEETAAVEAGPVLQITEACADNDFVWTLDFLDYIEFHNAGTSALNLGDYQLQVKKKTVSLPDACLEPGAYYVLPCDGKQIPTLSKSGCAVSILNADGHMVDSVILPSCKKQVWLREEGLSYIPSPGYPNTREGAAAWYNSVKNDLVISEAISANFKGSQSKQRGVDVVELRNTGKNSIKLSNYYLSDDRDRPAQYRLPNVTLKSGEYYTLYCTDNKSDERNTGFKLSSKGEVVYLSRGKNTIVDALNIPPLPLDDSYGRKGGVPGYFDKPTLGSGNISTQYARIAAQPQFSVASTGGCTEAFTVEIMGEEPIYYTTDGSVPNSSSTVYKGPITIQKTTTLRARAIPGDAARSPVATAEYRFDTAKYTLPCVVISVDRDYMTSTKYGLYRHPEDRDLEVPATATFIDPDGSVRFSQDCGFSVAGQTSRVRDNRGWKVSFRSKYGKNMLNCQTFDDSPITTFDSFVFRLGTTGNPIHDILGTAVGVGAMEDVLYQNYRPVNLFIAGTYYGIYYMREHVNANFIANHLGGDKDHVDMVYCVDETKLGSNRDWVALVEYCRTHNLAKQECYDYVAQRINVQSFMDYFIWRPYTGDTDHPNIRYVRSRNGSDPRWHIVIYDMDWAFQKKDIGMDKYTYKKYDEAKHNNVVIFSLLKNKGFRQAFLERLSYHMRNTFEPGRVTGILDELNAEVKHDMPASQKRWHSSMTAWNNAVKGIKTFIKTKTVDRRTLLLKETQKFFKLTDAQMKEYFGSIKFK